jgi:hypothetical protein
VATFNITTTHSPVNILTQLTETTSYTFQNVGLAPVRIAEFATDPSKEDPPIVGLIIYPGAKESWKAGTVPLWVWHEGGGSDNLLAVTDLA